MRSLAAKVEAVRCATARRGGKPCAGETCVCLGSASLLLLADELFDVVLRTAELTTRQRTAIVDWRRAYEQRETESAEDAPPALQRGVKVMTDPDGLRRGVDLMRLRRIFSEQPDHPVPTRVVAEVVAWVRRHLVTGPGRPRRPQGRPGRAARAAAVLLVLALGGVTAACSGGGETASMGPSADTGAAAASPDAGAPAPVTPKADASPPGPAPDARAVPPPADSGAPPPAPAGDASAPGQPPVCASPTGHAIYAVMVCYSAPGTPLNRQLMKDGRYCSACATQAPDLVTQEVFFGCTLDTTSRLLCVKSCTECK